MKKFQMAREAGDSAVIGDSPDTEALIVTISFVLITEGVRQVAMLMRFLRGMVAFSSLFVTIRGAAVPYRTQRFVH